MTSLKGLEYGTESHSGPVMLRSGEDFVPNPAVVKSTIFRRFQLARPMYKFIKSLNLLYILNWHAFRSIYLVDHKNSEID